MKFALKSILSAACLATMATAHAGLVNFETDTDGYKANGFVSSSGAGVSFSDTSGAELYVGNFSFQGIGKSMGVFGDDGSRLEMNFTSQMQSLSLAFGNDDACCSNSGDLAWLRLFDGASEVGVVSLLMNRNDVMDQTISYTGALFNRAQFYYGNAAGNAINLIEIVDTISFTEGNAVPTPGTLALVGLGILAAGVTTRRKKA